MIGSREQLVHLLTEAAEIEHNLMCSYLYAAFSLRTEAGEGLDEHQARSVAGWRNAILSVAIEEMGHLALVNNLLVAVGGSAHFGRPNLPVPAGYHPASFVIRLTPFDEATLDHFIFLERPEDAAISDGADFVPEAELERLAPARHLTPSSSDYETIGEFYAEIRRHVTALDGRFGPALFDRNAPQLGPDLVSLPGLARVTDVVSALAALDTIIEQGEGAPGEREDSHFARFTAIRREWALLRKADPAFRPAHPCAHDPVMRRPVDEDSRVWITEPASAQLLDLGNAIYGTALVLLLQIYSPALAPGERSACAGAALQLMHGLARVGATLAGMPAQPDLDGVAAGLSFAVPRNLGMRGAAFQDGARERLADLSRAYAAVFPDAPSPLGTALDYFGEREMLTKAG